MDCIPQIALCASAIIVVGLIFCIIFGRKTLTTTIKCLEKEKERLEEERKQLEKELQTANNNLVHTEALMDNMGTSGNLLLLLKQVLSFNEGDASFVTSRVNMILQGWEFIFDALDKIKKNHRDINGLFEAKKALKEEFLALLESAPFPGNLDLDILEGMFVRIEKLIPSILEQLNEVKEMKIELPIEAPSSQSEEPELGNDSSDKKIDQERREA